MSENTSNLTAWERWELASFDAAPAAAAAAKKPAAATPPPAETPPDLSAVKLPTAEEIEQIHQQAHDEGFKKGRGDGYQAGYKEGQAKALAEAQRFTHATAKLERALGELEASVADELLALATEIAREVVRQEISARPETLLSVVREALAQLPHQHAAIYLHPDDASLLRSYMGDQLTHAGHRLHEDFKLARGDCILEAGGTQVDASVAMRWRRVLEGLGIAAAWQPDPAAVPPAPASPQGAGRYEVAVPSNARDGASPHTFGPDEQ
jgi:flagellar assembly protein FliH